MKNVQSTRPGIVVDQLEHFLDALKLLKTPGMGGDVASQHVQVFSSLESGSRGRVAKRSAVPDLSLAIQVVAVRGSGRLDS
jgi:hypothetical protein